MERLGSRTRLWLAMLTVAAASVAVSVYLSRRSASRTSWAASTPATFVGSGSCKACHEPAYAKWMGSHHQQAMAVASEATVLGDFRGASFTHRGVTSRFSRSGDRFMVTTEGPDGKQADYSVAYTFGVWPLQQYLIPFPGGRFQALSVAWDVEQKRWFTLYPDQTIAPIDWLHWTRNAQNWNGMCAECHSTNLQKRYDPATDSYTTTWSEISVGCEACHGPGSQHLTWAALPARQRAGEPGARLRVKTSGIPGPQLVEQCGPCHSRRSEFGAAEKVGPTLLNHALPSLLDESLYYPDGQQQEEVYVYASFLQSKMYAKGVTCSNCHDSHSGKLRLEGNALCLQCHQAEKFDTPSHHFHKAEVGGRPSMAARCVSCHMPERTYMGVDGRADHSIRLPRPDLTVTIGVPNACGQSACHADKPAAWAASAIAARFGPTRRPHYGPALAAARTGTPGADAGLHALIDDATQPAIVRATALTLLERYPGPATQATLAKTAREADPLLRRAAALALADAQLDERIHLLAPLTADPVTGVRLAAAAGLPDVPAASLPPDRRESVAKSQTEYEQAMAYSLDFTAAGINLGNFFRARGEAARAEQYYRTAIKVDDLFFPAKLNLAVLLSEQGRAAEAERLLREVLAAYPANTDAAYSLGLLLVELGRPAEAVRYLGQAATGPPPHARARYNLGLLLQQLERSADAERALAGALALEPANPDFLFALADHYARRGRSADARPLLQRLRASAPGHPGLRPLEGLVGTR